MSHCFGNKIIKISSIFYILDSKFLVKFTESLKTRQICIVKNPKVKKK